MAKARAARIAAGVINQAIKNIVCKELAERKDKRDTERKKNGQPPFVPRACPANSLELEVPVPLSSWGLRDGRRDAEER